MLNTKSFYSKRVLKIEKGMDLNEALTLPYQWIDYKIASPKKLVKKILKAHQNNLKKLEIRQSFKSIKTPKFFICVLNKFKNLTQLNLFNLNFSLELDKFELKMKANLENLKSLGVFNSTLFLKYLNCHKIENLEVNDYEEYSSELSDFLENCRNLKNVKFFGIFPVFNLISHISKIEKLEIKFYKETENVKNLLNLQSNLSKNLIICCKNLFDKI